jgi:hypothetical protein
VDTTRATSFTTCADRSLLHIPRLLAPRGRTARIAVVALLILSLVSLVSVVEGAPGDLDLTFGTGGKVTTDFGAGEGAVGLVSQADGKLVCWLFRSR